MKVDTANLLHLITTKTRIRTMELADQLNHDIEEIKAALASLLDAGTIIAAYIIVPSA